MRLVKTAIAVVIAFSATAASAEVTIGIYKNWRKEQRESPAGQQLRAYLSGLGAGVAELNVMGKEFGGKRVYCPPAFSLGPDVVSSILDRELTSEPCKEASLTSTTFQLRLCSL